MTDKKTQRAVIVQKDRSIKVEQVEIPQVGDNEVLVKIVASVINPVDISYIRGYYPGCPQAPHRAGIEGSGTVAELGKSYNGSLKVGDKVCIVSENPKHQAWSEYVSLPASSVNLMNTSLSFEEAASHYVNPRTVAMMLHQIQKEGHKAVIHSAGASALGKMLIRLCKERGIKTINLVRRDDVKKELTELGADYVINMKDADFEQKLEEAIKKENATKFYDAIAGELTATVLRKMPADSSINVYGILSGDVKPHMLIPDLFTGKTVSGFVMNNVFDKLTKEEQDKVVKSIQDGLKTTYSSKINKVFPLEEINEAIKNSIDNASKGKTILKIA